MAKRYLIDTCAIIKYLSNGLPQTGIKFMDSVVDNESIISFISEIELQVWNAPKLADKVVYEEFVKGSEVILVDEMIISQTIEIRRNQKLKIPDAIITATAISRDLTLVSDNDKDFRKVPGLKYINPASMI